MAGWRMLTRLLAAVMLALPAAAAESPPQPPQQRMLLLDPTAEAILRTVLDRATQAPSKTPTSDARMTVLILNLLDAAPIVTEQPAPQGTVPP
jgi:hypothetical protein